MENTYKPELNEFVIGFEYMAEDSGDCVLGFHPSDWHLDRLEEFMMELHEGKITAYHLTEDDISEFFPVKHQGVRDGGSTMFEKGDRRLLFYRPNRMVKNKLRVKIEKLNTEYDAIINKYTTLFDGDIRNKFELKRILEQTNVI